MGRIHTLKWGGAYLGVVRTWIQHRFSNGELVKWGSEDVLQGTLTVRELEDLALKIARATLEDAGVRII